MAEPARNTTPQDDVELLPTTFDARTLSTAVRALPRAASTVVFSRRIVSSTTASKRVSLSGKWR